MAEIIRDRTWCYLKDDFGTEWEVVELRRWKDEWVECYPTDERSLYRIFKRRQYRSQYSPIDLEVRAYRFRPDEDRWFDARRWQEQLYAAEVRSIRVPGVPPLRDGYLLGPAG